jgi:hypothetical protein
MPIFMGGYKQENVRNKVLTYNQHLITNAYQKVKTTSNVQEDMYLINQSYHLLHSLLSIMRAFLFLVIVAVASAFTSPLMMKRKLQKCIYEKVMSSIIYFSLVDDVDS